MLALTDATWDDKHPAAKLSCAFPRGFDWALAIAVRAGGNQRQAQPCAQIARIGVRRDAYRQRSVLTAKCPASAARGADQPGVWPRPTLFDLLPL